MLGLLHGLQQDCTARPIVQVRPHHAAVVPAEGTGKSRRIPHRNHGFGLVPVAGSNIQIEVGQFELLLLFVLFYSDDPHRAVGEPHHGLIQRLGFQPADGSLKRRKPLFSMWVTMTPTLSMWAASMIFLPTPFW